MKKGLGLLLLFCCLSLSAWERVPIWPKNRMPDAQPHQIAAMTDKSGLEGFNPDKHRIAYLCLFALVLLTIVTRTPIWYVAVAVVAVGVFIVDRKILIKTDYVLLLTFFCFFVFSSSIAANEKIAAFLQRAVAGREYVWSILLSQAISNVPAAIVLYPFALNRGALLYGLDSAGLCTLIGSLASVINYRLYVREYPGKGGKFVKVFTLVSLAFFAFVALPGYFISRAWMI